MNRAQLRAKDETNDKRLAAALEEAAAAREDDVRPNLSLQIHIVLLFLPFSHGQIRRAVRDALVAAEARIIAARDETSRMRTERDSAQSALRAAQQHSDELEDALQASAGSLRSLHGQLAARTGAEPLPDAPSDADDEEDENSVVSGSEVSMVAEPAVSPPGSPLELSPFVSESKLQRGVDSACQTDSKPTASLAAVAFPLQALRASLRARREEVATLRQRLEVVSAEAEQTRASLREAEAAAAEDAATAAAGLANERMLAGMQTSHIQVRSFLSPSYPTHCRLLT
jgi:chromosome segregation ATPase